MATEQSITGGRAEQIEQNPQLRTGSLLMALAGVGFIGYGAVFLL
jgi:hypothetical protein